MGLRSRSNDEASVRGLHQGQQSVRTASTGRTHDCKRSLCRASKSLLPGGGHPHMKRRAFLGVMGSAVAAWPLAARAQQTAMPVIGFLRSAPLAASAHLITAFRQGLKEVGYVEGQNFVIEYRSVEDQGDRLPALIAGLMRRRPAVIVGDTPSILEARAANTTVPMV